MVSRADHKAFAEKHIDYGRRIVARQRQLIEEIRSRGSSTFESESLLAVFEDTLAIFEKDLQEISVSESED